MAESIEIRPTGAVLGADVQGIDFSSLDEHALARIREALGEHLVLRFRGTFARAISGSVLSASSSSAR